ncbi:hypothetical protein MMC24_000276 [Lignoscripta atroalba]|nr:hypothetical protein [Lignoscripta atroalba]
MSLPTSAVPLKDHCTVISDNTLYAYQPDAFQALALEQGGQWTQLPMGVSVKGGKCVLGTVDGQEALFIVGGATNSSSQQYPGLQRYTFADRTWETCTPQQQESVTQNRVMHAAAYLNSTSSILIYSGFQDGIFTPSSQTFTISTQAPYVVRAWSSYAPPVIQPILLSLNQSHAVTLGGDSQNKQIWTFSEQEGWRQSDVTLQSGLEDISKVQSAIVEGADGSKILEFYDMSMSPNRITTLALQSADGQGGPTQGAATSTSSPSDATETERPRKRRRQDVGPANRPAYNSTLAPQIIRNGFSLAQDPSGLVVVSGGDEYPLDPLCMFNQTGNQWINAKQFFNESSPSSDPAPPTIPISPAESITATPSPSSTSKPIVGSNASRNRTLTILGAVLGAVFGVAALLIILLLLLRYLRRRRRKTGRGEHLRDKKSKMDFADRGADFMKEAGGSLGDGSRKAVKSPQPTRSGHGKSDSGQSKRGLLHQAGDSGGSAKTFFGIGKSPPPPASPPSPEPNAVPYMSSTRQMEAHMTAAFASPEPRTDPRTDTGWSKYFTNNGSTTNLASLPPGYSRYDDQSRPTTYTSGSQSDYTSNSRVQSSHPHESAEVPPLNIRASQYAPSAPQSISPTLAATFSASGMVIPKGDPGAELPSPTYAVSNIDEEDEYLHGSDNSAGQESWTPVATSQRGSTWDERPPSSVYTDSTVYPHPGEKVRIPKFPGVPLSARSSQIVQGRGSQGLDHDSSSGTFVAGGVNTERELPEVGVRRVMPVPVSVPVSGSGHGNANANQETRPSPRRDQHEMDSDARYRQMAEEDMSWLNLGR